jgi:glycosyltransferase involved in cell wall biosynthesis
LNGFRPKALMVSPVMPAVTGNGLAMRAGLFLQALTRFADVDLLVVPVFGDIVPDAAAWANKSCGRVRVLDRGPPDTHFALIMRLKDPAARLDAFASYGRPSIGANLSPSVIAAAVELLQRERFDLIHVERSYCAPLGRAIAAHGGGSSVMTMDLDEDDGRLYTALADLAGRTIGPDARQWNQLEASAFRRLLADNAAGFDRLWVSSAMESASLRLSANPIETRLAPNAAPAIGPPRHRDDGRTVLFVGSLGYAPNQDAIAWFLSAIWPRLSRRRDLRLRIVGPNAPPALRRLGRQRGVEMPGRVPDLAPYYAAATLSIAPIRVGAGTRIKLIESAACGVPIVSTAVAAEGLGMRDGCDLWLADTAEAFGRAVEDALGHPQERRRRAGIARARANAAFDRDTLVGRLAREFAALL